MKDDITINYYDNNAEQFAGSTQAVNFSNVQDRFLNTLPNGAWILDFGCGSGRDSLYFLNKGYQVDAMDGSAKLCQIASETTGLTVQNMLFSELKEIDKYDGIWACASILHLPKSELSDVLCKMIRALKSDGYIYTSFKYGDFEGYRNGRYFSDFTEKSFQEYLESNTQVEIDECWISTDVRPDRRDEKWLNLILKKADTV